MSKHSTKRALSFSIFGLGILAGLCGCAAYVRTMFVVGENDSATAVWALTFALATPFPACLLALWKRVVAGLWLIFAGCFFVFGDLAQRTYMIQVRHFSDQLSVTKTVIGSLVIAAPLIAIGLFSVITGWLHWPLWETERFRSKDKTMV